MGKLAQAKRTPAERTAIGKKGARAAAKKYGADRMKRVRAGEKLKAIE